MGYGIRYLLKAAAVGWVSAAIAMPGPDDINVGQYGAVIKRDVCIIGGGSSGAFAAIQLKDKGKSVVVIEAKDKLGGHTETYTDPATGKHVDYGVVVWHDLPVVKEYFARLGVSIGPGALESAGGSGKQKFFDFDAGIEVTNHTNPDPSAALQAYAAQLAKYPYVDQGFELPDPVPEELLMPFGDFVAKYSLEGLVQLLFSFGQGLGDFLAQPTLYVFKNFGSDLVRVVVQRSFVATASGNNYELYAAAARDLGAANILYNSTVVRTLRSLPGRVLVLARTPAGPQLVLAKQLLLTAPPTLDNLRGWDLSAEERSLFGQFSNSAYYAAVLRDVPLPANVTTFLAAGAATPFQLPRLPGVYTVGATGVPGLVNIKYGAAQGLSDEAVRADILRSVRAVADDGAASNASFVAYSSHTPFELAVAPQAIRDGFYRRLYGLQGQRNTFYTGATFHTHDSSLLWNFTQAMVLPKMA